MTRTLSNTTIPTDASPVTDDVVALKKLRGQPVAIVTGASSGIGERIAIRLAERGCAVVLMARREQQLIRVAGLLDRTRPHAVLPVDLVDRDETERMIAMVVEHAGTPRALVNCAGVGLYRPFLDHEPADHEQIMRVNYHAACALTAAVLPGMLERGEGSIINVASIAVKMAPWGHAAYTASKAALVAMTQTLAAEHHGSGVHFSYVNPGIVRTAFFEKPSMQQLWKRIEKHAIDPDVVARKIVKLLDKPRLELCIPRHYRVLDWITAMSVGAVHRLVRKNSRP